MTSRIRTAIITAVIASCAAVPAGASARVATDPSTGSAPVEAVSGTSTGGGFQWVDAGVGAAGALILVGAFGTATGLRRRPAQG